MPSRRQVEKTLADARTANATDILHRDEFLLYARMTLEPHTYDRMFENTPEYQLISLVEIDDPAHGVTFEGKHYVGLYLYMNEIYKVVTRRNNYPIARVSLKKFMTESRLQVYGFTISR